MAGGTEGALSSGEAPPNADIGSIRSAFFAAGRTSDEAKNVAVTVATSIKSAQHVH